MLRKLLKYDFLSIRRYLIPLLILTPVVGFAFGMIGYAGNRIETPLVQMGLMTMYVIGLVALVLSVALLPVLLILRYYMGMFGDAGYITLLLPVSRKMLLLSKILYAVILMAGYVVIAFFSLGFAFFAPQTIGSGHGIFYSFTMSFEFVKGLFYYVGGSSAGGVVAIVFYLLFLLTFMFSLFYTGVTMGAAIFQGKAKIAGSIGFCIASYLMWSVIKTAIEAIPTAIIVRNGADTLMDPKVLLIFLLGETLLYAGFSVGLFFLNSHLIDRKLNLT